MKNGVRKQYHKLFWVSLILFVLLFGCTAGEKASDADKEAQYYMAPGAAAAKDGYYYIGRPTVSAESGINLLCYFDIAGMRTYPLCSRLNCPHTDESCEAALSNTECLSGSIWYYQGRIYMIESKAEQDELVSYDKQGRNKKTQAVLSVNGLSIGSSGKGVRFCVNQGNLYYLLRGEDTVYLYEVPLTGKQKPVLRKEYVRLDSMSLSAIGNYVYINRLQGISETKYNYIVERLDTQSGAVQELVNYQTAPFTFQGKIDDWLGEVCFDEENHFYFKSIEEADFILNRLDMNTNENTEFYRVKGTHKESGNPTSMSHQASDAKYVSIKGYDGKYIYLYHGFNVSAHMAEDVESINYLYVLGKDGKLAETCPLVYDDGKAAYLADSVLGGDERYLLVTIGQATVKGLELPEKWMEKYNALIASRKMPNVCGVGVLDKKQIGTGQAAWKNVTAQ